MEDTTEGLRTFLYDASGKDRQVDLTADTVRHLPKDQVVWIDADTTSDAAVERVAALVGLDDAALTGRTRLPVQERGEYFSFTLAALAAPSQDADLVDLTCAASATWLVTAHRGALRFVDDYDEHVRADSSLGDLDAPSFLASLLGWELNDYFEAIEAVQHRVDDMEEAILSGAEREDALDQLVGLRRRVTHLRGGLSRHRAVYAMLALPSFHEAAGSRAADDFGLLDSRVEQALKATESAREMIVGAFDLVMTRTAQRTNDVMKVLTTVSVLLLPAALLAGIFGMNMLPKFFLHSWVFWAVIGLMVAVSGSVLYAIHRRGWL